MDLLGHLRRLSDLSFSQVNFGRIKQIKSISFKLLLANLRLKWSKSAAGGQEPSQLEVIHSVIEFLVCSLLLHMFVANFIG